MDIKITLRVPDGFVDESDDSGMTSEGHDELMERLIGWDVVTGPDAA